MASVASFLLRLVVTTAAVGAFAGTAFRWQDAATPNLEPAAAPAVAPAAVLSPPPAAPSIPQHLDFKIIQSG